MLFNEVKSHEPGADISGMRRPTRAIASTMLLTCLLWLAACGGGGDDAMPFEAPTQVAQVVRTGADADADADANLTRNPTPPTLIGKPLPAAQAISAAAATTLRGDAVAPTRLVTLAARLTALAQSAGDASTSLGAIGPTARCAAGFTPPAALTAAQPAALPSSGGVFYSLADLATWRQRASGHRFVTAGDVQAGSPGDWQTIQRNADGFARGLESSFSATPSAQRTTHGTLLRDAAFAHLIAPEPGLLAKLRARLLAEAADPANDFSTLCLRELNGHVQDAWFGEAAWLLRYAVAYDFVRQALPAADRRLIDNFLRRNASLLAAQLDYGLNYVFPQRLLGNYAQRSTAAAASGEAIWASAQVDTNGDCRIDARDDPRAFAAYNYVGADGRRGPRTSVLSQWFNNRKAINAAAVGAAGVLLGDAGLTVRAKRYTMEWLTYGVWADGSEGEYLRNGDYCIAKQGVIYAASTVQSALLLARILARQGDSSLLRFKTRDGLFGTEAQPGQADKSLQTVVKTHLDLITGQLPWYQHEAHRAQQNPRPATFLGAPQVHYMGDVRGSDDHHALGLLMAARDLPNLPIAAVVLRDPAATLLRYPGSTGLPVATGFGSWVGSWTDAFNALPAVLFLN